MSDLYYAVPFRPGIDRATTVSHLMRSICEVESVFSDFTRACDEKCFECERCRNALATASRVLSNPRALVWEVWRQGEDAPVGVIALLPVSAMELHAHFTFFDGKLRGKEMLMEDVIQWAFERTGVRRITAEIPDYAFALARFVHRHLGFGGDFTFTRNGRSVQVEGVRKSAVRWKGVDRDVLVMGRVA